MVLFFLAGELHASGFFMDCTRSVTHNIFLMQREPDLTEPLQETRPVRHENNKQQTQPLGVNICTIRTPAIPATEEDT